MASDPTPWSIQPFVAIGSSVERFQVVDGNNKGVMVTSFRERAELIVAAVNAYEANTARLSELEAEVARLRSALEPFAKLADEVKKDGARPDGRTAWGFNNAELTWGDFRRARAALRSQS